MLDDNTLVTGAVLIAAFTHASWHALLKSETDMLQTIARVYGLCALVCLAAVAFVPLPSTRAFACIAASVLLHCASYVYITRAYAHTDLSHAFPLYRGLAPILVALGAWMLLDERPGSIALLGLLLAAGGVASLAFDERHRAPGRHLPIVALLLSALLIAAYTVVDGIGVRASTTPIGYVVWLFLLNGPAVMLLAWLVRRRKPTPRVRASAVRLTYASVLALLSHGLVIWAMSVGTLATVAALRETAVVFAAVLGTVALGEPFGRRRLAAAVFVTLGVMLLHTAG